MATAILFIQIPKEVMSQDKEELIRSDASGLFTPHNRVIPGLSQDDIRLRDEQARLAEQKEKEKRNVISRSGRTDNSYVPGHCTYFVKSKSPLAQNGWGDAKHWPVNSKEPTVGAIVKTSESWFGHVALVIEVKERTSVVEEMNYYGRYIISKREIPKNAWFIEGYLV
jgi:surface antigen